MDGYHFQLDPARLIEARLTKDEASVVQQYREVREQTPDDCETVYIAVPVSRSIIGELGREDVVARVERAAMRAIVDELHAATA